MRAAHRAVFLTGLLAATLLATPAAVAAAGESVGDAQSAHDTAAAEVARIQAQVTEAQDKLQRMTVEAEAASGAALTAQAELTTARAQADSTAAALDAARGAVDEARNAVATLGRQAYMGRDDSYGDVALLLDAAGPRELLQRAATLKVLGDKRAERLGEFQALEQRQDRADRAARTAVDERDRAARAAADAHAAADSQLAAAQVNYDAVVAQKAVLDQQLRDAETRLLSLQGGGNPPSAEAAGHAPTTLSAAAGAVAPTTGQITSCYGNRWGTLHAGIDFAAPIGTPIYAPEGGVIVAAGPASGFGLAVAIQHGDGTITLYGHVNQFFVSVGQVVSTGQQIAEVGNRGQSTGPHLHFEVHTGGLYVNRVNPVPWLTAHGISLGGACS